MKNRFLYLLPLALGLSLSACKKEEEKPAPTKTELLTNRNWLVSAQTINPGLSINGTVVTDFYAQQRGCDKDDFIRFETPNLLKVDEGATKCDPNDPQTTTGTWAFNADQTIITVTQSGMSQSLTLLEVTDGSLKMSNTQRINNLNYVVTTTYRKM